MLEWCMGFAALTVFIAAIIKLIVAKKATYLSPSKGFFI